MYDQVGYQMQCSIEPFETFLFLLNITHPCQEKTTAELDTHDGDICEHRWMNSVHDASNRLLCC